MEKNAGLVWPHYCAIPWPWLLVDYATCLCMRQCLQILMMYPYCWWLCLYYTLFYLHGSTAGSNHQEHSWISMQRSPSVWGWHINGVPLTWSLVYWMCMYIYICVCETCITVCRMFLNMYAYTNIYIRWYNDMMICIYLSNRIESNQIESHLISSIYTLHYIIYITLH